VIKEIDADAKTFGDARRTLIQAESRATLEVRVPDEPVTAIVSDKGWLRTQKGHGVALDNLTFKPGDALRAAFACRSTDTLWMLGRDGRAYSIAVSQLPGGRGDGQPVTAFVELPGSSLPEHYWTGPPETQLLLAGSGGYGFIAPAESLSSRQKAGKTFLRLEKGESPVALQPLRWPAQDGAVRTAERLALLTSGGRLLMFGIDELRELPRGGRGLQLIGLEPKETLIVALPCAAGDSLEVIGTGRGGTPKTLPLGPRAQQDYLAKRARKGKPVGNSAFKPTGLRVIAP
jgi:topoisomerase-4 subunit A